MIEGYIEPSKRKKILIICDDTRMASGIATMAREIIVGTSHRFNWVNLGGVIKHPEEGMQIDLSQSVNENAGISDSYVKLYPVSGYGNADIVRQLMKVEKPDAIMLFTDPRYFIWVFQMENEIRKYIPIIYLNIWDDLPYPMYNKNYYDSCDGLLAISKQTENINRVVLGDKAKNKVIKYVPHGINSKYFYSIDQNDEKAFQALQEFKKRKFHDKEYDFTLLYNARNISRKSVPNILLAWKIFLDGLYEQEKNKCCLVLHTQGIDENGTNLYAVRDMLFGNSPIKNNIIFSEDKYGIPEMNLLYNSSDAVILISSNEGWGLSLTEGMMCGKPIISNVTGGMQDQMRFEDNDGNWIKFSEKFGSNHRGRYKNHGKWAFPIFPSNITLIGSVPTPYIYDDRANPEDIAETIYKTWSEKINNPTEWKERGEAAKKWVMSDESMMSGKWMCKNVIDGIEETFTKFQPKSKFEFIKVEIPKDNFHYVKYPIC
jgi:glycosyltransferase involved in cell wall biosynthesis